MTADGTAPDIQAICERLIARGKVPAELERAWQQHPHFLALEDFVARHGRT